MRRNLILALLGVLGCSSGLAHGQDAEIKVGDWIVITRSQPDKSPNPLCILRSPEASGADRLQLANAIYTAPDVKTTHGNAALIVYTKDVVDVENPIDVKEVDFLVDGRSRWKVPATVTKLKDGKGAISATLDPEVSNVVARLAQGNALEAKVQLAAGSEIQLSVSLGGSARALAAFEKCLGTVSLK